MRRRRRAIGPLSTRSSWSSCRAPRPKADAHSPFAAVGRRRRTNCPRASAQRQFSMRLRAWWRCRHQPVAPHGARQLGPIGRPTGVQDSHHFAEVRGADVGAVDDERPRVEGVGVAEGVNSHHVGPKVTSSCGRCGTTSRMDTADAVGIKFTSERPEAASNSPNSASVRSRALPNMAII